VVGCTAGLDLDLDRDLGPFSDCRVRCPGFLVVTGTEGRMSRIAGRGYSLGLWDFEASLDNLSELKSLLEGLVAI
jgi:hypothetical protein